MPSVSSEVLRCLLPYSIAFFCLLFQRLRIPAENLQPLLIPNCSIRPCGEQCSSGTFLLLLVSLHLIELHFLLYNIVPNPA